jgi:ribosome biogenesis GTPase / thiamine phosphate phosphatase
MIIKKEKLYQTDIAVVGDKVNFDLNQDGTGAIYEIEQRRNYLSRKAPKKKGASYRGERLEQIIASNIDTLFVISSVQEPVFNNKVIDRMIVCAESSGIDVVIIINKSDLDPAKKIDSWVNLYKKIGYNTIKTSAISGENIKKIKSNLAGKKNLLWGQSGVGKSSIINKLYPDLNLEVGEISKLYEKGTHTTVTVKMIRVEDETFIIDTPGIREIDPFGIKKEDLGHYFIEFSDFIPDCKFNTCTHFHEPGCAVIEAVEDGKISEYRYDSYLRLLDTIEQDIIF